MANQDIIKQRGSFKIFEDDRGGNPLYSHPIIGIVKNNIDPLRSGKIQVYLNRLNASNEDDPNNWTWVNYASPFFGYTRNTASENSDGTFVGNRNSYGFWATPPDINTEVICVFINGQPDLGFYIASIPPATLIHMVPGIASAPAVIPNTGEANSYGGATSLPVTEINDANTKYENSEELNSLARPVHSYQAAILNEQGLIRDAVRGTITSSAMRESPSKVFGLSTPGNPIYAGGFNGKNNKPINEAVIDPNISDDQFTVIGRTGGHTFILDDGDINGNDKLVRLRTSNGHMILMNDSAQTLFIIHANGRSWIELGKEGTIDMYATNSVNIRTQGDLNLHADNNININAKKDLNISADNINLESIKATNQFVGTTYKGFTKGNYTLKVNSKMSLYSKDDSSIKSDKTNYLNGGPNVHLNTGSSSLIPKDVKQLPIIAHTDTLYDSSKGYAPAPGKLTSIVSRAPAHQPWANANQGVDVKTNLSATANFPSAPNTVVRQTNESVSGVAVNATTPAVIATVPNLNSVGNPLDKATTTALVSQMAVNASTGATTNASLEGAAITNVDGQKIISVGTIGLTPQQLEEAGYLKPGSSATVNANVNRGKSIEDSLPPNVFTGKNGIGSVNDLINNASVQATAAAEVLGNSEQKLIAAGAITGNESSTQTGGLILAAATVGVSPTLDALKQSAIGSGTIGIGERTASMLNASSKSAKELIASGNVAANIADKQNSGLGALIKNTGNSIKGAAASVWEKITGAFKKLTPNKPQNLTAINSENNQSTNNSITTPSAASASFIDKVKNSVSNLTTKDVAATLGAASLFTTGKSSERLATIAGGLFVAGNVLNNEKVREVTGKIGEKIKNVASNIFKGKKNVKSEVSNLQQQVQSSGGTINAYATLGLNEETVQSLQTQIAASGTPGAVDIKAPTVAINTFNMEEIKQQTDQLLENPKIPNPLDRA